MRSLKDRSRDEQKAAFANMRETSVYQEKYDKEPEPIRKKIRIKPVIRKKEVIRKKPKITVQKKPIEKTVSKPTPVVTKKPEGISRHSRFAELQAGDDTKAIRDKKVKSYFERMEDNNIKVTYDSLLCMYPKKYVDKEIEKGNIKKSGDTYTYKTVKEESDKGHTWLYGDKKRGYSMEHTGKGEWVTHIWQNGVIVGGDVASTEAEAREYIKDRENYYDGLKKSPSQQKYEDEADKREAIKNRAQKKLEEKHRGRSDFETALNVGVAKMPKKPGQGRNYKVREMKKLDKASPGKYKIVEWGEATWLNAGQAHNVADRLNKRGYDTMVFNKGSGGNIHTVYIITEKK